MPKPDTTREALLTLGTAAAATRDDFAPLPPEPTPHGPGAARQIAEALAAAGRHSHLAADGQLDCLTGQCVPTGTDGRWEQ